MFAKHIRRMTVTKFSSISMSAGFRRNLIGKTLRNVCYCDIASIGFVGKLMNI